MNSIIIDGSVLSIGQGQGQGQRTLEVVACISKNEHFILRAIVPNYIWDKEIGDEELCGKEVRIVGEAYFDGNAFCVNTGALEIKKSAEELEAEALRIRAECAERRKAFVESLTLENVFEFICEDLYDALIELTIYRKCNNEELKIVDLYRDDANRLMLLFLHDSEENNIIISVQELFKNFKFSK